jgi:hypothetical protein
VLYRRLSLRCITPLSPIWFPPRSSNFSVYIERLRLTRGKQKRVEELLCCVLKQQRNFVLLGPRFRCSKDEVWLVSVWNNRDVRDREKRRITVLYTRALARYCAPSFAILLWTRFSNLSVYIKSVQERDTQKENHFVLLQGIGKISCSLISNVVAKEIQCCECLW